MNKYRILIALVLIFVLLAAGCGTTADEPATDPTVYVPSNEGNEAIDIIPENEGVGQRPTESVEPTEETVATEATKPSEATKPTEEATKPTETTASAQATQPTEQEKKPCCDYGVYLTLSPEGQQTFMNSFASTMDFIQWCRDGEAAHKEHDETITGEGDEFDISDILDKINGKS